MRYLLVALLLAITALLAACAPGDLADVHQGPPFVFDVSGLPADYQADAETAAAEWNAAKGVGFAVIAADGENRVVLGEIPNGYTLARTVCDGPACIVTISRTEVYPGCPDLFVHEMGHVFGSHWDHPVDPIHSPNPADVMFAMFGCDKRLTAADVASIPY